MNLSIESHYEKPLRPMTAKQTNKKINLGGTQIMFKKQSEVNPPSDVILSDSENQEKSILEEEKKEDLIPLVVQSERTEEEEKKLNNEKSVDKDPEVMHNEEKSEPGQTEVVAEPEPVEEEKVEEAKVEERLSDDDEDIPSDPIKLDHNVQSNIRNIKLEQIKFVADAENGLSHNRMDYVTTRIHPHVSKKSGILLVH